MASERKSEQTRGCKEAVQQFEVLRAKWPKAFPLRSSEIRPLALGVVKPAQEAFGWSAPYTRGVLRVWKLRADYCRAILAYPYRINLDGEKDGEVDDTARQAAQKQLAAIKAKREKKAAYERLKASLPSTSAETPTQAAQSCCATR